MTVEEWEKDFKSFVNELQMPRDDYKGIMEYIDDAISLLKEQEHKDRMFRALEDDWKRLKELLKEQPEIVRCKDCKFMIEDDVFQCGIRAGYFPVHEEWFCADGERKEVMRDDSTIFQRNCAGTQCGGQDPEGT